MSSDRELRVRPMEVRDLEEVAAIDTASFPVPWPLDGFLRELVENEFSCCWVAEDAGRVIGMLVGWLVVDEFEIGTIAVHPEHRRRGAGAKLLEAALQSAKQNGARRAVLEVRVGNRDAISLYEQFGFKIGGRRPRFYSDGEDALIMNNEV